MKPPIPENEARRLKVLWEYEVLDTVPEEVFDTLTELAARICQAPIALISLVDEDRQWFKSRVGVGEKQTSRDVSFCAYAITQPELFIVPDATKDPRFSSNPMVVSDPRIRFYAGAPLITPDGYALGTLCVIDMKPRELRKDQQDALMVLSRHIVSQLELRRRTNELSNARKFEKSQQERIESLERRLAQAKRKLSQTRKPTAVTKSSRSKASAGSKRSKSASKRR